MKYDNNTLKKYTKQEILQHNNIKSCWIVSDNIVYDATSFLDKHPGGIESILKKAGGVENCNTDFSYHSKKTQKNLIKFQIGILEENNNDKECIVM